jgi:hypothetical protein
LGGGGGGAGGAGAVKVGDQLTILRRVSTQPMLHRLYIYREFLLYINVYSLSYFLC